MALAVPVNIVISPLFYLALVPFLYLIRKPLLRLITPQGLPGIPSLPNPAPVIGDIPWIATLRKDVESETRMLDSVGNVVGPIAQIRVGFFKPMVIVTDYQETESILNRHSDFDRGNVTMSVFRHLIPTGQLSLPTDTMWKHHRRIIGPAMTSKHLSLTTPRANEAVKALIGLLRAKADKAGGRGFEVEADMESATMDAMCAMAFGSSWGIVNGCTEQVKALSADDISMGPLDEAVFKTTRPLIANSTWYMFEALPQFSLFPALTYFFRSLRPAHRMHKRNLETYLLGRLAESRKKTKAMGGEAAAELADNTLDMMVARESRAEDWMSDKEMLDEVLLYLIAGTETSGVTLTWWLKYMTNDPAVQRKLRDHILSRMPELQDRQPTFEDLNATNLPYLEAVVTETLRLSRTAGGYLRETKTDTVILGHRVPKGTSVVCTTATGIEDASTPTAGAYRSQADINADPLREKVQASEEKQDVLVRQSEALDARRLDTANKRKVGYWAAGSGKRFDPDRWIDEKGEFDPNAGPSLPFSLGQRGCFGKNLALLELRLFMSQLSLAFFFAPVPDKQNGMELFETVAAHPKQSFVRPVSWDSDEAKAAV